MSLNVPDIERPQHQVDYFVVMARTTQTTVLAGCFSVSIIHRTLTWITGFLTCEKMSMHANAHMGVWTPKESALKVDFS